MYKTWMKGKGAHEFAIQRGAVRNSKLQTRLEGREIVAKKHDLDREDKIAGAEPVVERYSAKNADGSDKYNVSTGDATKIEYWLTDRTGKNYLDDPEDGPYNNLVQEAIVKYKIDADQATKFIVADFRWRAARDTARADGKLVGKTEAEIEAMVGKRPTPGDTQKAQKTKKKKSSTP